MRLPSVSWMIAKKFCGPSGDLVPAGTGDIAVYGVRQE
jgi:hypothetical protein